MRPAPVVVPPNPITPEEYAKKLGVSRKRFLEIKAITDRALAETLSKSESELEREMDAIDAGVDDLFSTKDGKLSGSKQSGPAKSSARRPNGKRAAIKH